ncbi:MAG TPA: amidohydrolase family protein [Anaerolineales bacterium]|nr:amidohydrolase family protein [Anaerolineales bacterium]
METSKTNFVMDYKPGADARVELKNGRILDVINGRYFEAGKRVILQNGKIESLQGSNGGADGSNSDFSIDLQGKTVLPSLFNTHCHLATAGPTMLPGLRERGLIKKRTGQQQDKQMADCLAHGITHVRDAWRPYLGENRVLKERISRGDIPGPRILQAVAVGLPGSYLQEKLSLGMKALGMEQIDPAKEDAGSVAFPIDATEGQIRDAVDIAIDERGAEVIKIGDETSSLISGNPVPTMTIEQLSTVADQARLRGVQSMMHHTSVESFRRGVKAGVSSLEHEPFDALLTQADIEAFKAAGCISDPTISAFYAILSWKMAKDRSNGHPELNRLTEFRDKTYTFAEIANEYFIPEFHASVMNSYKKLTSGKPKIMGIIDMSLMFAWDPKAAIGFENFCALFEHGVPMTTANDTMPPCTAAMMDLELRMMDHVLKGNPDGKQLSGAEAVKIATINSARSLGLEDRFGSIESGKTADLVIMDGNPLQDFRLIGNQVSALFMDGNLVINNCALNVEAISKA